VRRATTKEKKARVPNDKVGQLYGKGKKMICGGGRLSLGGERKKGGVGGGDRGVF